MGKISQPEAPNEIYLIILSGFVWFLALTDACKKSDASTIRLLQNDPDKKI